VVIGESLGICRIREEIRDIASSECNVLITGETGTGKELVAHAIHEGSRRASKPLITVNCAAIPDSLFESEFFGHRRGAFTGAYAANQGKMQSADGGTVFLDEIGELSLLSQAKLLRLIESREIQPIGANQPITVNIRLVAATNQNLDRQVAEGHFRYDLFYRLNVVRVQIPPLRERKEDIAALVQYFIEDLNRRDSRSVEGFDEEATAVLLSHDWPGNVRELRNVLEAIFVRHRTGRVGRGDLPEHFLQSLTSSSADNSERTRLLSTLEAVHWNKTEAARQLKWSRMTLYRKMARYELNSNHQPAPQIHKASSAS
jgi:transcriptional regulator with PAS, ATPase and Fis domain